MTQEHPPHSGPHAFQAEVSRLLHLMVHSVYTEKEVFLRELVSNASDACDKLRYKAIAKPELLGDDPRLAIRISADGEHGTLTVVDNGIGMSEAELIDNLGTIARSGTRAFLDKIASETDSSSLIGQFGVGFYSAFMVADRIEVISRKAGEGPCWLWESSGSDGFSVSAAPADRAASCPRGTVITLHLKADAREFVDDGEIERIIKTYSDHILFPVELVGSGGSARQINSASALWHRSRSEVTPDEYKEVYGTLSGQYDDPAVTIHYKAEGRQSFAALLFVPTRRPYDLFDVERKGRVKLYVRRVYITEDAALLPGYLRFVRGAVDSEDVPLNISREMLQNNPQVAQIRRAITQRVIGELQTLADKEPERFASVWDAFGAVLKEGIYEDFERRDEMMKLARFRTTSGETLRSLAQYVADMKSGQTEIYYLVGESMDQLKASPKLEAARERGIEVLLLTDPVDAFWAALGLSFDGKSLRSLSQGEVDLTAVPVTETAIAAATPAADIEAIVSAIKSALGDEVSDVKASQRLVTSAVCLVAPGHGPDRSLERLLQRQGRGIGIKPVLEINPSHALIRAVGGAVSAGQDDTVEDLARLMLDQARLLEGELPAEPARFAERLNRYVVQGLASAAPQQE